MNGAAKRNQVAAALEREPERRAEAAWKRVPVGRALNREIAQKRPRKPARELNQKH